MRTLTTNMHRWKNSLDDRLRAVFEDAAEHLRWAWDLDQQDPNSYPVNTGNAFGEIANNITTQPTTQATTHKRLKLRLPPPPKKLSDLLDEPDIQRIYEEQNNDSYVQALKEAAGSRGNKAWRKIWRAANAA
jgi:hypothetical protein